MRLFLLAAVVLLARAAGAQIALAAPTGRAAKRLEELCDAPASTLHRLLGARGRDGGFARGEHNPLDADLVVVDEASPRCNIATDVSALVAQLAFASLKAPIRMVTPPHTPVPFSDALEELYLPDAARVASAICETLRYAA